VSDTTLEKLAKRSFQRDLDTNFYKGEFSTWEELPEEEKRYHQNMASIWIERPRNKWPTWMDKIGDYL